VQGFSDALINVVRAWVELWIRKLTLTWGEPFLRKDIFEIINSISSTSNDIMLGITSNGFLLTPNKIRALAWKVHKINLNFQSARDDNFAEITWVKGLQKITSLSYFCSQHEFMWHSILYLPQKIKMILIMFSNMPKSLDVI
jgi:molybdenum cofactor biosynthesis enzyme MoaA